MADGVQVVILWLDGGRRLVIADAVGMALEFFSPANSVPGDSAFKGITCLFD